LSNLTEAELSKILASNPELQIVDDGYTMKEIRIPSRDEILQSIMDDTSRIQTIKNPPEIKYKSETEARAHEWLRQMEDCVEVLYEPIMVRMPGGNYTPDFLCRMDNREQWFVEVKGSWDAYKSGRSSKKSLKEASKVYWFMGRWFSLLPVKGGGWNMEEVK
jgi:predicted nuclease of restriction endonuclease-like RecB superfamily